jgi:hypothetical protein
MNDIPPQMTGLRRPGSTRLAVVQGISSIRIIDGFNIYTFSWVQCIPHCAQPAKSEFRRSYLLILSRAVESMASVIARFLLAQVAQSCKGWGRWRRTVVMLRCDTTNKLRTRPNRRSRVRFECIPWQSNRLKPQLLTQKLLHPMSRMTSQGYLYVIAWIYMAQLVRFRLIDSGWMSRSYVCMSSTIVYPKYGAKNKLQLFYEGWMQNVWMQLSRRLVHEPQPCALSRIYGRFILLSLSDLLYAV